MENKKKIIAIVVFVILGLSIFAFAGSDEQLENNEQATDKQQEVSKTNNDDIQKGNGSEEQTNRENNVNDTKRVNNIKNNNTTESNNGGKITDNSYDLAKNAVIKLESSLTIEDYNTAKELVNNVTDATEKEELEKRVNNAKKSIDAIALMEELESIYNNDLTIKNLDKSRTFKTEKEVEQAIDLVENDEVKENLLSRMANLNKVLNDMTNPVVTGAPANGLTNENVTLIITDTTNVTKKVLLNGQETNEFANTNTYTQEGKYEITYIDEAFNETKIEFTIDKTAPVVLSINKSNNDKSTNQDVTVTITFNEGVISPEGWNKISETEYSKVYSENGKNTVVFTDYAGNTVDVFFEIKRIDKIAPNATVTTSNNDLPTNKDVTVTITANEAIYKPSGWTEVVTNKEHEFTKVYSESGRYSVEITDKAGNKSTIYYEVKGIDKEAPVVDSLNIIFANSNYYNENGKTVAYLKNNEYMYFFLIFKEKLDKLPTVTLNNTKTYDVTLLKESDNSYTYMAQIKLTDGDGLKDGKVSFTVKDYADKAGNVGVTLTNEYITKELQKEVIIDRTPAEINISEGTIGSNPYSKLNLKLFDENKIAKIVINGNPLTHTGNKYADINDGDAYTFVEGENVVEVTDRAGNVTTKTFIKDTTAPVLTVHSLVGKEPHYSQISFKLSDNYAIDYFILNGKKYERTNAKWSDANYQNIKNDLKDGQNTITLYDAAGNFTEYKFELDLIAPTISIKNDSVIKNCIYSQISFKLSDDHLIDKFVVNGKTFDVTDNMWGDANFDAIKGVLKEGKNTIVLYDTACNKSELEFEYSSYTLVMTFEDLKKAFATGGKVKLLNDIEVEEQLVLKNGISLTLNMNGKKMTLSKEVDLDTIDPMMDIKSGSKITITGNGTFDLEDNYSASLMYPRGDVIIENGTFLRDAGGTGYGSYFVGISGGKGKLIIYDGYFDGGYYKEGDEFNNSRSLLNGSWGQYIRVYGGTFVGQNPAYGDEGMAFTNPNRIKTNYCQTLFFEGQKREDTQIPVEYTVIEGTHQDGRPTYTVHYNK